MVVRVHEYDAERVARAEAYARAVGARVAARAAERASVASSPASEQAKLASSPRVSSVPGYAVTALDFGDGIVEARAVFVDPRRRLRAPRADDGERVERVERGDTPEKREWRLRRARRTLRYRCLALKADHMLTFTKRGKFGSLDEVREAWRRFYKLVRRFPKLDFRYVAVPELHGDGKTWHLHVAVRGYYDVSFLRRLWYRALGGRGDERGEAAPGGLNAKWFHNRRKSALVVAGYMSKYLGKSFAATDRARGKRYWCSEGLLPLSVQRWWEPYGDCVLLNVRDAVAPMAPRNVMWRIFEWEWVGTHGFIMKTH